MTTVSRFWINFPAGLDRAMRLLERCADRQPGRHRLASGGPWSRWGFALQTGAALDALRRPNVRDLIMSGAPHAIVSRPDGTFEVHYTPEHTAAVARATFLANRSARRHVLALACFAQGGASALALHDTGRAAFRDKAGEEAILNAVLGWYAERWPERAPWARPDLHPLVALRRHEADHWR